jgi:hypothetical protein
LTNLSRVTLPLNLPHNRIESLRPLVPSVEKLLKEIKAGTLRRERMTKAKTKRKQHQRARAIDAILRRRRTQKPVTNSQIRAARVTGRP